MENEEIKEIVEENVDNIENNQLLASPNDYYYYDSYYNSVLNKMDNIISKENTILSNQDDIVYKTNDILNWSCVLVFLVSLVFIYTYLRNIIIVK